jgi:glycosyltransferase involved in cell wall biosynthesis
MSIDCESDDNSRSKTVVLLSWNLRRGGHERVLVSLAIGFSRQGRKVKIVSITGPNAFEKELEDAGIELVKVFKKAPYIWTSLLRISNLVREECINVGRSKVLVFGGQALIVARLARLRNLIYCAQNASGLHWNSLRPGYMVLNIAERLAFSDPGISIVACSNSVKQAYLDRFGKREKAEVILNGVSTKCVNEKIRSSFSDPLQIVFVGTLYYQKRPLMALKALADLHEMDVNAHLTFVGDGPDREELEDAVSGSGMEGKVTFAGSRPDARIFMAASDILWLTSRYEGFGLVLVEAMLEGALVIATRVAGVVDVVIDGVTGVLVDETSKAVAEATRSATKQQQKVLEMRQFAKDNARNNYSEEKMCNKYSEFLDEA